MLSNYMKRKFYYAIILIPIVNALANVTTNYYPEGTINPGFIRTLFLLILIAMFIVNYKVSGRIITILYVFLVYNLIFVLMNDDLVTPLISYVKLAVSLFMLPIGFIMIKDQDSLLALLKASMVALFMLCANYVLSNIYGIGKTAYLKESFYIGGTNVGLISDLSIYVICGFIFLIINNTRKWNYFTIALIVASNIIVLLSMRRSAVLVLGAGMIICIIYSKFKLKYIKYIIITTIMAVGMLPYYSSELIDRYEYRAQSRRGSLINYEREARYHEIFWVIDDIKDDAKKLIIGTHNLNSENYFRMGRGLHVGYINMLHGSGLVGLSLFLYLMFQILMKEMFLYKNIVKNSVDIHLHTLFIALFVALLIHLTSNIIYQFSVIPTCFLMFGAISSVFSKKLNRKPFHNEIADNSIN